MGEHYIRVGRTARYYTLGGGGDVREVWIACHGYAQLARFFARWFEPVADASRLIVTPEALNRYYEETSRGVHGPDARVLATWMTREDREHEVADYVAYLDAVADEVLSDVGVGTRVVAFGFSQGAATVSRWVALGRTRVNRVILWGSSIAHDLPLRADVFHGAPLTIAIGDQDGAVSPARLAQEDARLRDAGIEYRLVRYAGGHRVTEDALRELAAE